MPRNTQKRRPEAVSGVHLWLVLWKATRAVEAVARRNVQDLDIGLTDFAVLEALLHKGPLPVQALGAKVLLTSGSMTAAVDRLERRRLVIRRGDPGDRRARIIHLTARGRASITRLFARHQRAMERAGSVLSAKERATLVKLLRKLGRGVESLEQGAAAAGGSKASVRTALSRQESKRRRR